MLILAFVPDEFSALHIRPAELQSLAALWHVDPRKDCDSRQLNWFIPVHALLYRVLLIHREQAADVAPASSGAPNDCLCSRL